jgi:chemotaxis protein CheD
MEPIVVGMAECRFAYQNGQRLVTYGLGSCIALAAHDPVARVGGLLHFMLPDSAIDPERGRKVPWMFADLAIPTLLDTLLRRGAAKPRLEAHAAGGARMLAESGGFEIGRRNHEALRRHLAEAGVRLLSEAVGGSVSRNLRLEVGTGRIWLWEGGKGRHGGQPKDTGVDRR